MRMTKFSHACVRVEGAGGAIVIDPGAFSEVEALDQAAAVLITHEHADHVHPEHLRASDAPIWTIAAVERMLRRDAPDVAERVRVVAPGEHLEIAGLAVEVVGDKHAVIHPDYERFDNSGYILSDGTASLYHPGDSLVVPPRAVDVLCVPISAPWLKMSEAIDFAREVAAPTSLGIHNAVYSDIGISMVRAHMDNLLPAGQAFELREAGTDL